MDKYYTVGLRFIALIIDSLITVPIALAALYFPLNSGNPNVIVFYCFVSLIPIFYYILFHARFGQTLGKIAIKIKVLDVSERPITFSQAVLRSLPNMLPIFITASSIFLTYSKEAGVFFGKILAAFYALYCLWSLFDIIVCMSSDKKRSLHDFIAGTVVVKTKF